MSFLFGTQVEQSQVEVYVSAVQELNQVPLDIDLAVFFIGAGSSSYGQARLICRENKVLIKSEVLHVPVEGFANVSATFRQTVTTMRACFTKIRFENKPVFKLLFVCKSGLNRSVFQAAVFYGIVNKVCTPDGVERMISLLRERRENAFEKDKWKNVLTLYRVFGDKVTAEGLQFSNASKTNCRITSSNGCWMDLGCGEGASFRESRTGLRKNVSFFLNDVVPQGLHRVGMDVSKNMLRLADLKINLKMETTSLDDIDLERLEEDAERDAESARLLAHCLYYGVKCEVDELAAAEWNAKAFEMSRATEHGGAQKQFEFTVGGFEEIAARFDGSAALVTSIFSVHFAKRTGLKNAFGNMARAMTEGGLLVLVFPDGRAINYALRHSWRERNSGAEQDFTLQKKENGELLFSLTGSVTQNQDTEPIVFPSEIVENAKSWFRVLPVSEPSLQGLAHALPGNPDPNNLLFELYSFLVLERNDAKAPPRTGSATTDDSGYDAPVTNREKTPYVRKTIASLRSAVASIVKDTLNDVFFKVDRPGVVANGSAVRSMTYGTEISKTGRLASKEIELLVGKFLTSNLTPPFPCFVPQPCALSIPMALPRSFHRLSASSVVRGSPCKVSYKADGVTAAVVVNIVPGRIFLKERSGALLEVNMEGLGDVSTKCVVFGEIIQKQFYGFEVICSEKHDWCSSFEERSHNLGFKNWKRWYSSLEEMEPASFPVDGLILQKLNACVAEDDFALKLKAKNKRSVDLLVLDTPTVHNCGVAFGRNGDGKCRTPYRYVVASENGEWPVPNTIAEFCIKEDGSLFFLRTREDKTQPNMQSTIASEQLASIEDCSTEELARFLGGKRVFEEHCSHCLVSCCNDATVFACRFCKKAGPLETFYPDPKRRHFFKNLADTCSSREGWNDVKKSDASKLYRIANKFFENVSAAIRDNPLLADAFRESCNYSETVGYLKIKSLLKNVHKSALNGDFVTNSIGSVDQHQPFNCSCPKCKLCDSFFFRVCTYE